MALLFLGKLLIAAGIAFQAYLLYDDKATSTAFDARLSTVLGACDCIPADIKAHIREYGRLVVAAFLSFSVLTVIARASILKIPVILGLISLLVVRHFPFTTVPSFKDQAFWELVGIIGGYIYLLGAESCCGTKSKSKETTKPNQTNQTKPQAQAQASTQPSKSNKKRN